LASFAIIQLDTADQTLLAEVVERVAVETIIAVIPHIAFGHDAECADHRQRAAVLAVQLVDAIAVDDQFARLAARQVKVVHQPVARIMVGSLALVVHARPPVVAFAGIVPSRVVHRPSCTVFGAVRTCVKAAGQELRGAIQASPWRAGSKTAAPKAWS
jgi:hypothetical protein